MEYRGKPDGRGCVRGVLSIWPVEASTPLLAAAATDLRPVLERARQAQAQWEQISVHERLKTIRRLRHSIAHNAEALAAAVPLSVPGSLHRTLADTLAAEVLPLADACRFLEQQAPSILSSRKLSRRGRPLFFRHVAATVERVPLGVVLVIGPANYPLLLPAVQTLQALVAGNAVLWKPASTGAEAARMLARLLTSAGMPSDLVTVLDTDIEASRQAITEGVDKVVLTGHVSTGKDVLRSLSETVTPAVMELSGCDAVFILPGADLRHAARVIAFGMRLNGSATCMAPRRIFVAASEADRFAASLLERLREVPAVTLPSATMHEFYSLIDEATEQGAVVENVSSNTDTVRPVLIRHGRPEMRCMQTDIFAPLLSMTEVAGSTDAVHAHRACPYSLTASIFGPPREARRLARRLRVGTVLINDIILPTADPRLPFGGRGMSGFGTTRGAEGLLEMTAVRTVATQMRPNKRAYDATTEAHTPFFGAYIRAIHGGSWAARATAMRALTRAARDLPKHSKRFKE